MARPEAPVPLDVLPLDPVEALPPGFVPGVTFEAEGGAAGPDPPEPAAPDGPLVLGAELVPPVATPALPWAIVPGAHGLPSGPTLTAPEEDVPPVDVCATSAGAKARRLTAVAARRIFFMGPRGSRGKVRCALGGTTPLKQQSHAGPVPASTAANLLKSTSAHPRSKNIVPGIATVS
jgi:hypothetical protein